MHNRTIYDISVLLGEETITYPGDTPYSREVVAQITKPGEAEISMLHLNAHCGTHLDAPAHFIAGGKRIDEYSIEDFILPATVVEIADPEQITVEELQSADLRPGEAVLFKTDNSRSGRCCNGVFSERFVYLPLEAAEFLIAKKVVLVGIDYISIERYGDSEYPVHRALLGQGVLILEALNLGDVPAGRYNLFCAPLRIKDGEAAPVRVFLSTK